MGRERKALADRVQAWRGVTDSLRNDLEQFPQLEGSLADLEGIDVEARALMAEMSTLRGCGPRRPGSAPWPAGAT